MDSYQYMTQNGLFALKTYNYFANLSYQNGYRASDDLNYITSSPVGCGYDSLKDKEDDITDICKRYRMECHKKVHKVDCLTYSKYYLKTEKSTKI